MADRRLVRAELERKRIQLAQMKLDRERRSQILREGENSSQTSDSRERIEDADAILHALGISSPISRVSTAPSNVSSMDQAAQSSTNAPSPDISHIVAQQSSSLNDTFSPNLSLKSPVPLQVVHVNQVDIPPKEILTYTKETQTPTPTTPSHSQDQTATQGDTLQQNPYYGKQTNVTSGKRSRNHPSTGSNSISTPVAGVNQLALEWDDEFPGMSRAELKTKHCTTN